MELTWRRWLIVALGGALLLGVVFRPVPQATPFTRNPGAKFSMSRSLLVYRGRLIGKQLVERQFSDSVIGALAQARATTAPLFDSRVPASVRETITKRAEPLLRDAANASTPLAIAVTVADRDDIQRNAGNMLYVLPARVAHAPCIVVARIPLHHLERLTSAGRDSALIKSFNTTFGGFPTAQDLGLCGFFNAFGEPSPQVALTLRDQGWIAASGGYSRGSPAPPAMWGVTPYFNAFYSNRERADGIVACASGRTAVCRDAVFSAGVTIGTPVPPSSDFVVGARLEPLRGNSGMRAHLLGDLARELGAEKFGRVWRSPTDIPAGYAAVTGEPFDTYLLRWLQHAIGKTAIGPQLSVHILLVTLVSVLLGLVVGILTHTSRRLA
jgi:hypothetical protein